MHFPLAPDALEPDTVPSEPDPPILWLVEYLRRYVGYPLSKPLACVRLWNGESCPCGPTLAVWKNLCYWILLDEWSWNFCSSEVNASVSEWRRLERAAKPRWWRRRRRQWSNSVVWNMPLLQSDKHTLNHIEVRFLFLSTYTFCQGWHRLWS